MPGGANLLGVDARQPIQLNSSAFHENKYAWYQWMRDEAPLCEGKISVMRVHLVSRFDDCRSLLTDDRFLRNRGRARGKGTSPLPFPLPRAVAAIAQSMILEDDPAHRRLRSLVNQAFTPRAIEGLADRIQALSQQVLDELGPGPPIDLLSAYARPIPSLVIAEMIGVERSDMVAFHALMDSLSSASTSGLRVFRTLFWDLRKSAQFVRELVDRKRKNPGDDLLTRLIEAEEDGERLSEDELLAMVFLLIIAGFETTLHLITNGVRVLLEHPDQLETLRSQPDHWDSAVNEVVRYRGPIHGTKLLYASEDVEIHGKHLKRGSAVMPLLGAANHDPREFEEPEKFDIHRVDNHHLGFGIGRHFCLGRQLALMETRVALESLFDRYPNLHLAVPPEELEIARVAGWHRHVRLPVALR